jgi:iron complex transport system ATP-binding protein
VKTKTVVDIKNVSLVCDGHNILTDITWQISQGQCCAVIGPNGAGKSALIAVISGYCWPNKGSVSVLGQTYGHVNLQSVREGIGLIEPSRMPGFNGRMTIRNVIATGLFGSIMLPLHRKITSKEWEKADSQISFFGLQDLSSTQMRKLSTGERTKTLIARAMVAEPHLLILDEPTSGLDMGNRAVVVKILNKLREIANRPTVIIVSHHLEELPKSLDKVLLIRNGRIVKQGKPEEVLNSTDLSKTFNCEIKVLQNNGSYMTQVQL